MTREELIEKTREAFLAGGVSKDWRDALQETVDIVLEEAAKIADGSFPFDMEIWLNSTKKEMTAHTGRAVADAIRALKGG